jgi:hypothetical protein
MCYSIGGVMRHSRLPETGNALVGLFFIGFAAKLASAIS